MRLGEIGGMDETRRLRLTYPLERLSAPVVTHLVTDFDLTPNLLRADVDAHAGGWMIVEVTGNAVKIGAALDWMRAQGLGVDEAA